MDSMYKLTYFNGRGLAEIIRLLFAYTGENFEDIRLDREKDWPEFKPKTPFGKLPMLEVNGKPLTQSVAISRYLAKKAGLAGKDDWENLQIDIILDTFTDLRQGVYTFYRETNEDLKKTKKDTYINETLPFYLKKLDTVVKENEGFFANKKLSLADFAFAVLTEQLDLVTELPDITADYPDLHSLKEKIFNLPQIKKWVEKRPVTPW